MAGDRLPERASDTHERGKEDNQVLWREELKVKHVVEHEDSKTDRGEKRGRKGRWKQDGKRETKLIRERESGRR